MVQCALMRALKLRAPKAEHLNSHLRSCVNRTCFLSHGGCLRPHFEQPSLRSLVAGIHEHIMPGNGVQTDATDANHYCSVCPCMVDLLVCVFSCDNYPQREGGQPRTALLIDETQLRQGAPQAQPSCAAGLHDETPVSSTACAATTLSSRS